MSIFSSVLSIICIHDGRHKLFKQIYQEFQIESQELEVDIKLSEGELRCLEFVSCDIIIHTL